MQILSLSLSEKASNRQQLEYWKPQPSFLYGCVCLRAMLLVLTEDPPQIVGISRACLDKLENQGLLEVEG